MITKSMKTGLGEFSKAKFNNLLDVRGAALCGIRTSLSELGFTEVTTASLVNIAGSCENPHASFTLNYYGREAHLSQSAQIQLESLVLRLNRAVFTVNNSFREENFDDPDMAGRRLSEFTLIEPEMPMPDKSPEEALQKVIMTEQRVVQETIRSVLDTCETQVSELGGDVSYLALSCDGDFPQVSYDDALDILRKNGKDVEFGHDLDIRDEREIMAAFGNKPVFVTNFPASIKFFNMKRMPDGERVYSVDLLTPMLGETTGGAVRENDSEMIKDFLRGTDIAKVVEEKGGDVFETFQEYFQIFDQEPEVILRGGFGIGFERFIGFLLNSNDILDTIAYRTLQPG